METPFALLYNSLNQGRFNKYRLPQATGYCREQGIFREHFRQCDNG
jgi:hypothetical protein